MLPENHITQERIQIFGEDYLSPDMKLLRKLETLMEKEFMNHRPVPFYGGELGMTAECLNNLTRAYYGKTVRELLQDKLLKAAQYLLSHSLLSVKCIAYELGFEDPAYFTRWFIRVYGVGPKVYRRGNYRLKVWVW